MLVYLAREGMLLNNMGEYARMCVYIYIYTFVYIYICVNIYIYTCTITKTQLHTWSRHHTNIVFT